MPFPTVQTGQVADASISEAKLSFDVQHKLNRADGERITFPMTLAESLAAWVCVRTNLDGELIRCTNAAAHQQACIGVTTQAGTAGEAVTVLAQGRATDSSFSRFAVGDVLFVGSDGTLTAIPPNTGYIQVVATVIAAEELAVLPGLAMLQE